MKFTTAAALAALAAITEAKVILTNTKYDVVAGEPFTVTWTGNAGPVTISLKDGQSGNLHTVQVIDSADSGASFTWTPSATLPSGTYAFEITDGADINYSPQFDIVGGPSVSSTAVSSSVTSPSPTSALSSATSSSSSSVASSSAASPSAASSSAASSSSVSSSSANSSAISSFSSPTASHSTLLTSTVSNSTATASKYIISATGSAGTIGISGTPTPSSTIIPANTNDSQRFKSPLALVLVTVAALLYFN